MVLALAGDSTMTSWCHQDDMMGLLVGDVDDGFVDEESMDMIDLLRGFLATDLLVVDLEVLDFVVVDFLLELLLELLSGLLVFVVELVSLVLRGPDLDAVGVVLRAIVRSKQIHKVIYLICA